MENASFHVYIKIGAYGSCNQNNVPGARRKTVIRKENNNFNRILPYKRMFPRTQLKLLGAP